MQQNNNSIYSFAIKNEEDSLLTFFIVPLIVGLVGIIGYPCTISGIGTMLGFIGLLIGISSFVVGFFTGTLFGMPRRNPTIESDYTLNNSLVEISDWLTKIIVGLGLVNLKRIPEILMGMGKYVSLATNNTVQSLDIYTMCIIVYFSVFGLYMGYNYMRLILSQKYKHADLNLLSKELINHNIETESLKSNLIEEQYQNRTLQNVLKNTRTLNFESTGNDYLNEMKKIANDKLINGIKINPTDPQKNQWGSKTMNKNRQISATVNELAGLYKVLVTIKSTNPRDFPLENEQVILLALHNTFGNPPFRFMTVTNGEASTEIICYGSFTIGAILDYGKTELELDLAELPGVSSKFKST